MTEVAFVPKNQPNRPRKWSPEQRKRQSEITTKYFKDKLKRQQHQQRMVESHSTDKWKREQSERIKALWQDPKYKEIVQQTRYKKYTPDVRTRISAIMKKRWQCMEYKSKFLKGTLAFPNHTESSLLQLLQELGMSDFKYVGDRKMWISDRDNTRFNPDFVSKERRAIIELFGEYWHTSEKDRVVDVKKLLCYNRHGYKFLVIWGREIKNLPKLREKLIAFDERTALELKK